jgi:hypothetical protein
MNLLLGLATMVVCLALQSLLVVIALRYYARSEALVSSPSMMTSLAVISGVMMLLLAGNILQVGIWALLFVILGEFVHFDEALYHSAVNFSTLGYGDLVMSLKHRMLGPLEAINGVIMIGVSTAILLTAFKDALDKTADARRN